MMLMNDDTREMQDLCVYETMKGLLEFWLGFFVSG